VVVEVTEDWTMMLPMWENVELQRRRFGLRWGCCR